MHACHYLPALSPLSFSFLPLRSLQKNLLKGDGILSKEDKSPVTIADFAVQALVIYYLSECFPSDLFIAEESSELLRENKVRICSTPNGQQDKCAALHCIDSDTSRLRVTVPSHLTSLSYCYLITTHSQHLCNLTIRDASLSICSFACQSVGRSVVILSFLF